MPHNLAQTGGDSPVHGKHGTFAFTHRRQLGRITHKHQTRLKRMGALQSNRQKRAVDHRGLIDQHQAQMFQGSGGLLGGFTELPVPLAFELQAQQAMNRGGIPGGVQALECQRLAQHADGLVGGSHHGPAQTTGLHFTQEAHGQKGLAATSETAQHEGQTSILLLQPVGEGSGGLGLILREAQFGMGRRCHPRASAMVCAN